MLTQKTSLENRETNRDSKKIIFIGDDSEMLKVLTLSVHLRWPDVSPIPLPVAEQGLDLVDQVSPDVVMIGPRQPGMSAPAVVEEVRRFSQVPVMVFSREDDEMEAVTSLELGADDYIRFPCGMLEIMARMWACLRRAGSGVSRSEIGRTIYSGQLLINPSTYEVFSGNRQVSLTVTEFRMLHLLARNRGTVVSHQCMEENLWGEGGDNIQVSKKYVQLLRQKLGDNAADPQWIASIRGVGYRFIGPKPHSPVS